jgi:hypothetical protein
LHLQACGISVKSMKVFKRSSENSSKGEPEGVLSALVWGYF